MSTYPYVKYCKNCGDKFNTDSNHKMICITCRNKSRPLKKKRYTIEFKRIKRTILERDNYECQFCKNNKSLVVHHINCDRSDNYAENLITLCTPCHFSLHSKYSHTILRRKDINELKPSGFVEGKYGNRPIYN